jgi:hypothetical protein
LVHSPVVKKSDRLSLESKNRRFYMVQNGTVVFMMFVTDVLMVVILVLQVGLRNRLKIPQTPQANTPELAAMAENMSRINKNVIEMAKLNQETIQLNKAIIAVIPAAVGACQDPAVVKDAVGGNGSGHKAESRADLWPEMDDPEVPALDTSAPADPPQPPKLYNPVKPVRTFMDPHDPKAWSPEERKAFGEQMKQRRAEQKAKREAEAQSQEETTP